MFNCVVVIKYYLLVLPKVLNLQKKKFFSSFCFFSPSPNPLILFPPTGGLNFGRALVFNEHSYCNQVGIIFDTTNLGHELRSLICFCTVPMLIFSRGNATLHLAVSVGRSVRRSVGPVTFLNYELLPNRPRLDCRVSGLVSSRLILFFPLSLETKWERQYVSDCTDRLIDTSPLLVFRSLLASSGSMLSTLGLLP